VPGRAPVRVRPIRSLAHRPCRADERSGVAVRVAAPWDQGDAPPEAASAGLEIMFTPGAVPAPDCGSTVDRHLAPVARSTSGAGGSCS